MPTLAELEAVARGASPPPLDNADRERIGAARAVIEDAVASELSVYGVTTGFGQLASVRVPPADAARLQVNLLRSHAVGSGPPLEEEVVRGMLLLLAGSLRRGHSGARVELVELVLGLLERGVVPVVPSRGSVGSSGDLAPLAHLGLVLIGEGEATVAGERMPGGQALARAGLEPIVLSAKEGLALINGTHLMAAAGALAVREARAACWTRRSSRPHCRSRRSRDPPCRSTSGCTRCGPSPVPLARRPGYGGFLPGARSWKATPTAAGCRTHTPCAARRR